MKFFNPHRGPKILFLKNDDLTITYVAYLTNDYDAEAFARARR
jgi:hypothetical protein